MPSARKIRWRFPTCLTRAWSAGPSLTRAGPAGPLDRCLVAATGSFRRTCHPGLRTQSRVPAGFPGLSLCRRHCCSNPHSPPAPLPRPTPGHSHRFQCPGCPDSSGDAGGLPASLSRTRRGNGLAGHRFVGRWFSQLDSSAGRTLDAGLPAIHFRLDGFATRRHGSSRQPDAQPEFGAPDVGLGFRVGGAVLAAVLPRHGVDWSNTRVPFRRLSLVPDVTNLLHATTPPLAPGHYSLPCHSLGGTQLRL